MFIPLHDANQLQHIRLQFVTIAIIAINCLVFVVIGASSLQDDSFARAAFYSFGYVPAVANGTATLPVELHFLPEWTDYFTYAFLHGDFWHLAGNMLFLWVFADNVEDATGHLRFAFFFAATAAAGAYAHLLADPVSEQPLIGASGAASGVVAAYLMLHPHVKLWVLALGRIPLRLRAYWLLGAWILFQFASFLALPEDDVSFAAHIGGAVAGAALIPFLKRRSVPLFDRGLPDAKPQEPGPAASAAAGHEAGGREGQTPVVWGRREPS
jgi:membrane associated rhomboid family serine protease